MPFRRPTDVALRVLDANANRAVEGFRVIEEIARFALDDSDQTAALKQLRHRLVGQLDTIPRLTRIAARDVTGDVGTVVTTPQETNREDLTAVLQANISRAHESVRCLEEFGKTVDSGFARGMEQIRYDFYSLARQLELALASSCWLESAYLYVLTDGGASEDDLRSRISRLVNAEVDVIQLRDKTLCDHELLTRARVVRQLTRQTATRFIVNDRPDIALLCEADGVHVGQEEISVADARRILDVRQVIGVSTHDIDQARRAVTDGADYIGCGPTFPSQTKQFERFPGIDFLAQVAAEISIPAFAIGGVHAGNLGGVLSAGISRIAVSGAISGSDDPEQAVAELRAALDGRV